MAHHKGKTQWVKIKKVKEIRMMPFVDVNWSKNAAKCKGCYIDKGEADVVRLEVGTGKPGEVIHLCAHCFELLRSDMNTFAEYDPQIKNTRLKRRKRK